MADDDIHIVSVSSQTNPPPVTKNAETQTHPQIEEVPQKRTSEGSVLIDIEITDGEIDQVVIEQLLGEN